MTTVPGAGGVAKAAGAGAVWNWLIVASSGKDPGGVFGAAGADMACRAYSAVSAFSADQQYLHADATLTPASEKSASSKAVK